MENHSIIKKCADKQSISLSNTNVNFDAGMQICKELSVQPTPSAAMNCHRSMEIIPKRHLAKPPMETVQAEDRDIYAVLDSGYSIVLVRANLWRSSRTGRAVTLWSNRQPPFPLFGLLRLTTLYCSAFSVSYSCSTATYSKAISSEHSRKNRPSRFLRLIARAEG